MTLSHIPLGAFALLGLALGKALVLIDKIRDIREMRKRRKNGKP